MAKSPEEHAHQEWLGYVQPVGLVVSVPAMLDAQCYINKNIMAEHARFLGCLPRDNADDVTPEICDLREFVQSVLGWEAEDLVEVPQKVALEGDMASLEIVLPQYHETLRPTQAVPVFKPEDGQNPWMLLVQELPSDTDLDETVEADSSQHWNATPQAKFERLLRETEVPIGLLSNGRQLRLVYSPRGETSGHATFNVDEMMQVAGRPMFAALHMLLCCERMFSLGEKQRLPAILEHSRKYQNTVSTQLAEQVMSALFELLRGFQAADDQRKGDLLREVLANNPQHVYHGLLTILMRMVFVLFAEDRDLVSSDPIYANHYSITGLFNRLREDAGRYPDTMNLRFGAWSQLLTLFRLVYDGGQHRELTIPPRKGYLFDPNRYPFLEGRYDDGDTNVDSEEELTSEIQIPRLSDGVVYRVLEDLLILDGERLSYRTLDVEQIGSVYEAIMGFELQVSEGRSIAIKPVKRHGAPATINLEVLLEEKPADRAKRLKEWTDHKITGAALKELKAAATIDDLLAALDKKIAKHVTPNIVPSDSMVFQPSDERRRSGSHYTPRSLTEPIVRTTLEPILKQLTDSAAEVPDVWEPTSADKKRYTKGEIQLRIKASERHIKYVQSAREIGVPHPSQILDLKICDPAMGSGAFLVEACRQLGDVLIDAWHAHDMAPTDIPADEDEVLYARRLVAQRCLYGVDKNVMAVDLAKLSLWLVTLARDHAFTFLDHSLRHGDSLVGLTREQIIGFHWDRKKFKTLLNEPIQKRLDRATEARAKILNAREDVPYKDQEQRLAVADEALDLIRILGDACVSCFFAESKKKAREEEADRVYGLASSYLESQKQPQVDHASRTGLQEAAARLRDSSQEHPVPAFHWEIEFPEVFSRENGGFDAFVGNPPFLGGTKISEVSGMPYFQFLVTAFPPCEHHCDLVAYFLRNCFTKLRIGGCFGLITTNTVAQGDTREGGLRTILSSGGHIYNAKTRFGWPGQAAVVVSVVHVSKSAAIPDSILDGRAVKRISAYLVAGHADESPKRLASNPYFSLGSKIYGQGFLFADGDPLCTPIEVRTRILATHPDWAYRMQPYLVGEEINSHPLQQPRRYAIYLSDIETEEELDRFPELRDIVAQKVKPGRLSLGNNPNNKPLKKRWWAYQAHRPDLYETLKTLDRTICLSRVGQALAFAFSSTDIVFSEQVVVLALDSSSAFAILQSRVHETWARFFASSMKDDLRYTPSDCFQTFPFCDDFASHPALNQAGQSYYEARQRFLVDENLGLTKTYNRFHSPDERDEGILELRRLHGLMDGAVLRAYGWDDLAESALRSDFCEFLLDYEEEEDDESPATGKRSKKKKPWRYRWPDDFRDEVLARLLELNEQRHKEELLVGAATPVSKNDAPKRTDSKSTRKEKASKQPRQKEMF